MAKSNADSESAAKVGKTFSSDVVAALLYTTGTTSLSRKQYDLMSSLDGTKTANGFQHDFRSILAKAKELKARIESGEAFEPVQPAQKRSDKSSPATPRKRKITDDSDATPTKKAKAALKGRAKKAPIQDASDSDGEALPEDADAFIKQEAEWAAHEFA